MSPILTRTARRIDNAERSFSRQIARALARYARAEAGKAASNPEAYLRRVSKSAEDDARREIERLIRLFGIRHVETAMRLQGAKLDGSLMRDAIEQKPIKLVYIQEWSDGIEQRVKDITDATRDMVRRSVKQIVAQSTNVERHWNPNINGGDGGWVKGSPSAGEIARRIRTQWHGTAEGKEFALSSERAAIIARTELVQAENTGLMQGYKEIGVQWIEWLAYTDGRSGKRRHERMNGVRIKIGDTFKLPSGVSLRYPGDPSAPIGETIQCRCTTRPVRSHN